jgi:biogenesis of lysosome-related organelles complex 1 subunit 1
VSEVFTNQKQLEVEAKNLQAQAAKYAKQTSQWLTMIDSFNTALKARRPSHAPVVRVY